MASLSRDIFDRRYALENGHAAVAVGFQVVEGELNFLVVFVNGIDQAAFRFTRQGEDVAVAVGVELELTAAEGDFLILFLVVQRFQSNIGTGVTGIADAGINLERRFLAISNSGLVTSLFTSTV
jgi:hypothetical protein